MQRDSDRRVTGVPRVPVERVVDVCERDSPTSAFQGRSVDISGRGMQLSASRPPERETPLVLRFREQGQEIIAEGEVAWCNEGPDGAEFGVRFTALDSRSVQSLKLLCQPDGTLEGSDEPEDSHDTDPAPPAAPLVKLHIAGLGEPMRAQVRDQGSQGLKVASGLDFLRLGRSVDVEDMAHGGRRGAEIAGVEVALDEVSRVPELVVSLRYAEQEPARRPAPLQPLRAVARAATASVDESDAPFAVAARRSSGRRPPLDVSDVPPAVAPSRSMPPRARDAGAQPLDLRHARRDAPLQEPAEAAPDTDPSVDVEDELHGAVDGFPDGDAGDHGISDAQRLRERMDGVISGVSVAARVASEQAVRLGGAASRGARWLAEHAKSAAHSSERAAARRRTTSAAPRTLMRSSPMLRHSPVRALGSANSPAPRSGRRRPALRVALAAGLLTTIALGIGLLLGSPSENSAVAAPAVPGAAQLAPPPAPAAVSEPAPSSPPPPAPAPSAPGPVEQGEPDEDALAVAQVPLFGPTSLGAKATSDMSEIEPRPLARAKVSDETFGDSAPRAPAKQASPNEFGQGRMHLPIVYRLRLDQPGQGLRGERTPTGFDVVIPGRKAMESGTSISRRDERISRVVTRNGPEGARVSFRFRGPIPAYKVRLRKDFIEFFISS